MPEITFTLSEETSEKIKTYTQITGNDINIEECILEHICMFIPANGINQKATYLKGASELEKIIAENEGHKIETEEIPCTVIEKLELLDRTYYRIVLDGRILSVSAESLRFEQAEKKSGKKKKAK